mgnify:FL=1
MMNKRKNKSLVFPKKMYFFIIPAAVFFIVFWVLPVFQLFYYSVTNFDGINYNYDFIGLKNYISLFESGEAFNSIKNTVIYTVVMVAGSNIFGLALAMALNVRIKGKTAFRTISFIPTLFSAVVVGFIWSYVYMPGNGMVSSIINGL